MSSYLIPSGRKAAWELSLGYVVAPLVDKSGTVTHWVVNDDSGTVDDAAATAAGATVFESVEAAIAASGAHREQTDAVQSDLHAKARQALAANATYLDIPTPSNAQAVAQVAALTRQTNALIRLLLAGDLLDASDDT